MTRSAEGWFESEARCGAGARYRYRLADGLAVPDPAARAQADDVHGPSLVVDPGAYRWQHPGWRGRPWHETVLYELHAGLLGGFAGVQAALPGLAALGVTAVELMPVNAFPGTRNWGYDGVLPFAPARSYGTPDELKALVDAAHGLGLMIFLDVVYNHFGPDGNYLAAYAPGFFRDDIATPWGGAIDFRRPEVRRFFTENALYWLLEYRFDGLRFDAVHAISEADWLDEMAAEVRATVEPGRHAHLVLEHEGNASEHLRRGFDAQWNDDAHHVLHVLLTGERDGYYADYAVGAGRQAGALPGPGFRLSGRALGLSRRQAARVAQRRPRAHRLRALPAEPRPDRQPSVRRPPDRVRRSRGAGGRHRPAAPLPAGSADLHGRGGCERARPSSISPTITANWPRPCARGGGASSRASRDSRPARPRTRSPIRMRRKPSTAAGPRRAASRAPAGRHSTGSCWRCAPQF